MNKEKHLRDQKLLLWSRHLPMVIIGQERYSETVSIVAKRLKLIQRYEVWRFTGCWSGVNDRVWRFEKRHYEIADDYV